MRHVEVLCKYNDTLIYTLSVTTSHTCTYTHIVPAFQHGLSLDTLLCRFAVEPPYFSSVEAKLIRQNCPLKTKLHGNLLQCLQVNYSILKKKKKDMQTHLKIKGFKKDSLPSVTVSMNVNEMSLLI